jgi:hypothetical protein
MGITFLSPICICTISDILAASEFLMIGLKVMKIRNLLTFKFLLLFSILKAKLIAVIWNLLFFLFICPISYWKFLKLLVPSVIYQTVF